jgi:hypothetical protein
MAKKVTAMGKDPSKEATKDTGASKWTRIGAGQYKDQYGNVLKGQKTRPNVNRAKQAAPAPDATGAAQEQTAQGMGEDLYRQYAGYARNFNPQTFQQQYEPQFNEQMTRAYDTTMNQFNLRNERAFAQQKEALDQEAANKGWDPGGELYQRRSREMMDAQNQARQEAQNQAWQQAQGVQQQGYQQATGAALLPGQVMEPYMFPYQANMAQQYNMQTLGQQQQYAKELAALENKYRLQQIRATPRGGGGGGAPAVDQFQEYLNAQTMSRYAPQGAQPNPWATGAQAFAQGASAAFIKQMDKKG